MASVNWKKMTTQTAGAMKRHLGQYEREHGNHSNEHIDKKLSHQNYCIGCDDFSDAFDAMKKRVAEVDKMYPPERKRADRKTACFLEIPCPNEIRLQGKSDDFFAKSFELMQNFFGKENVHGGFVHKDELHEYRDKDGSIKMSMEHMHLLVSAYAEWQQKDRKTGEMVERKGINGRNFETRPRLNKLNNMMQEMCQREFGVSFNTGEKPQKKSVERLKNESALREKADALREQIDGMERELATIDAQCEESNADLRKLTALEQEKEAEIAKANERLEAVERQIKDYQKQQSDLQSDVQQLTEKKTQLQSNVEQAALKKVSEFLSGKGSKKVAAAEAIVANADEVKKAMTIEKSHELAQVKKLTDQLQLKEKQLDKTAQEQEQTAKQQTYTARQQYQKEQALSQREESLHQAQQQLAQQQQRLVWTAKSQARYEAEKLLAGGGYVRKVNPDQQRLMQSQMHSQTTREQLQQTHNADYEIER